MPRERMTIDEIKNTVICGDCLSVMRQMPDKCVDLVVTSPPYDNLRKYNGYSFDFENIAKELFRVIKDGGVVVWVVGDETKDGDESGESFRQALFFKSVGFNLLDTMIYNKNSFRFPQPNRYHQVFEYMFVFTKGKPKTFNPLFDRKNIHTNRNSDNMKRETDGTITYRDKFQQTEYGKRFNIWTYAIGKGGSTSDEVAFEHPAIFPESLAKDHILSWSNNGDIVMDIFSGSGTTAKMAVQTGRDFIVIDISPEYCELARARILQAETGVTVKEQKAGQKSLWP